MNLIDFSFNYEFKQFITTRVDMSQFKRDRFGKITRKDRQRIFIAFLEEIVRENDKYYGTIEGGKPASARSSTSIKGIIAETGCTTDEAVIIQRERQKEKRRLNYQTNSDERRAKARAYAAREYASGRKKKYMEEYYHRKAAEKKALTDDELAQMSPEEREKAKRKEYMREYYKKNNVSMREYVRIKRAEQYADPVKRAKMIESVKKSQRKKKEIIENISSEIEKSLAENNI